MCGLTGFFDLRCEQGTEELRATVRQMAGRLHHRGPDDGGEWVDPAAGIALGFRRLAIIDLTEEGHQPMVSDSGRYILVFNGEIYNYPALREALEKLPPSHRPHFHGHSDTEVMLGAFESWGLEESLARFNGMFAFVLWDRLERTLTLGRDRFGEKPLYYGWQGQTFLFGSELKALRAHPSFDADTHRDVLTLYLRHNCIPAPYSIYEGIHKLPPGTFLTLPANGRTLPLPETYWSAKEVVESSLSQPLRGSEQELIEQLSELLREAVGLRMMADVPLGAFLSGGIDSSTVVAYMQSQSSRAVKTYTIGYNEGDYSEARHAKAVAQHLGTDHTEFYVTGEQAREVIPLLPTLYDEPFADCSQIPTYLVSKLARQHVTVGLSGDGGDELFGGYSRYLWSSSLWNRSRRVPRSLRGLVSGALMAVSPKAWERLFRVARPILPHPLRQRNPGDKMLKMAEALTVRSHEEMYMGFASHWKSPLEVVLNAKEPPSLLTEKACWAETTDFSQQMMYLDAVTWLPDDILVKMDRASMGVSLEARAPLLDPSLFEFAWRLPLRLKIRDGKGKWLLRQALYRHVPRELIERPKMGFNVPIDTWLRGPLREWAEDLLSERALREEGVFRPEPIRHVWAQHLAGKRNGQYLLWDVLMFQAWQRANA